MWRVKDTLTKKDLKVALRIFGLCCLLGCAVIVVFMLTGIAVRGYFYAVEPDRLILFAEIVVAAFGLAYVFYLFQKTLGGKPQK